MSDGTEQLPRFKPERPLYLNESNTGKKSKAEVLVLIEDLRKRRWLCTYNEKVRPLHLSFNDVSQFNAFKKDCKDLGVTLKTPLIKPDDIEAMEVEDAKPGDLGAPKDAELTSTAQDPDGKVHIE